MIFKYKADSTGSDGYILKLASLKAITSTDAMKEEPGCYKNLRKNQKLKTLVAQPLGGKQLAKQLKETFLDSSLC